MSDEYTAEALINDIIGSFRAFWEDFSHAYTHRKNEWSTALVSTLDDPPVFYEIRVRKLSDEDVEDLV